MGGRGAASGWSHNRAGKPLHQYGTEYKTVLSSGKYDFIENVTDYNKIPMETQDKGRVYVLVNKTSKELKATIHFDENGMRSKEIHLDHNHKVNGKRLKPHTHVGYEHEESEGRDVTPFEREEIEKVNRIWQKHRES